MDKEKYKLYAEDLIQDISNRIDELQQRAVGINPKIHAEFSEKMSNLMRMRDDLKEMLNDFDNIPENRWEEAKLEFMNSMNYLKQGFQKLFSVLSR